MDDDQLAQQQLMMVNMDPTMHTRYRRLVNKGFTPKMVRDLEEQIVGYADGIIDAVCERGTADFVEEISAELPLLVIAELLGVPQEDRRMVFDWSNRMIGSEDPEYQMPGADPGEAAMQVYSLRRGAGDGPKARPQGGPRLGPAQCGGGGREAERAGARPLLPAPHRGRQRDDPEPHVGCHDRLLRSPRPVGAAPPGPFPSPGAVEEMLRYVTPVMHFRRTATGDMELHGQQIKEGDKVVFWHASANRDEAAFADPDTFDVTRSPNNHIAFGGGGPHFCLGANLARMEIMVMFDRLLERIPDMRLDGEVQRLQSNFINGTKHIPIAFAPSAPAGGTPLPARAH